MSNNATISTIRPPAIAGIFYPASKTELERTIRKLLSDSNVEFGPKIKACIVPHAGLIYSGSTAAKVYSILNSQKLDSFEHILIIGPSHRKYFSGLAVPSCSVFETPLGQVKVDTKLIEKLLKLEFVIQDDAAHQYEHCLEIQLPFLQTISDNLKITPMLFSDTSVSEIATVIEKLSEEENTLIIVSSDLSHFHDYQTAVSIDSQTSQMIERFNYTDISSHQACGSTAIKGLLKAANSNNLNIKKISLCNSGDTAGDKSRVVGYGSYVLY